MTIENDKKLYVGLFNALTDPCGCNDAYCIIYQKYLKETEEQYGEETTRKWIEDD